MGKKIITVCMLLALAVQTFNNAVIITSYFANAAAYAQNCENKALPMLHCNGKCQMMKKLKQEENKEKQNPGRRFNTEEYICSNPLTSSYVVHTEPIAKYGSFHTFIIPDKRVTSFFHPPGA